MNFGTFQNTFRARQGASTAHGASTGKAGDVVWAGAYLGLLIRKKTSNRWMVEYFGFCNKTGSEKIENIVAFHFGNFVPRIKDEDTANFAGAITEMVQYTEATN
ncbi:unnamed protein product [Caenorhabditis nigoni]